MTNKTLLRIADCETRLGLGRTKIYELIASGELRAVHIGRAVRIPAVEIERFVETLQAEQCDGIIE